MKRSSIAHTALILALLLLLFARLTLESRALSFTTDEPLHISAGYTYVADRATWTTPLRGHPLLVDAWFALPFYFGQPKIPIHTLDGWGESAALFVRAFTPYIANHVEGAERATRIPASLLTILFAAAVTRWAADLFGPSKGWLALLILSLDPLVLGHGMLATNDMGVTAFGTLALYATYRLTKQQTAPSSLVRMLRTSLLPGLFYGATLLAKGSGPIWLVGGLLTLGTAMLIRSPSGKTVMRWIVTSFFITAIALLLVWAFYSFEVGLVAGTPIPFLAPTHWNAILMQGGSTDSRHLYFLGQNARGGGWWAYFPVAFLIKNPLPFLILIAWGGWAAIRSRRRAHGPLLGLFWFPLLYGTLAVGSKMNTGYRHLLPLHPFFYFAALAPLGLASLSPRPARQMHVLRLAVATLVVWMALESFSIAPHHITYFNQIVGGPDQGWRYLADSNTDWRQGYKLVKAYVDATGETVAFSGPNGDVGLEAYGVDAIPLPPLPGSSEPLFRPHIRPPAGRYVISADSLSGRGPTEPDNYAWFRYQEPDAILGHILFIYDVEPMPASTWVAQCSVPTTPLPVEALQQGFAASIDRHVVFDCTQSWIVPASGDGWYILHDANLSHGTPWLHRTGLRSLVPADSFVARSTAPFRMTYRQLDYRQVPAFVVYGSPAGQIPTSLESCQAYSAPAESLPGTLTAPQRAPVTFGSSLDFLGVEPVAPTDRRSGAFELVSWWRVGEMLPSRPLSMMAHLVSDQGQPLGVADGLGIPIQSWRQGDLLMQRHTFPQVGSPSGGELWLRTGVYWLDTGERWRLPNSDADALFVALQGAP